MPGVSSNIAAGVEAFGYRARPREGTGPWVSAPSLDELHEKVDAVQEKLEEIEAQQDKKTYVNPIDL